MKRISHEQSRRNSARRKRKVTSRHRRAGRRRARANPVFASGGLHYEIGARASAMSFGGIGAVGRLVSKLKLAREIDRRLELLKRHLPYHESDHVLNIAYNLLCGGARLEDLGGLRHDAAYMDALGAELIPSPTAAGDFTRRFSGAGGLRGRGRDAGAHAGPEEGGHGHVLQGGVGLPPAGRVVGQHGRGALPRQPTGQRGESPGRGGVDRQGGRTGGAPRRTGVRAGTRTSR